MTPNAFDRLNRAAATAVGAALLAWLYFRTLAVSLTHDEALTYLHAIEPGLARLLRFGYQDANNHLLNSLLSWSSASVFGATEWALRLPNLLAFGLYACFAFRLATRLLSRVFVLPALLLLLMNPFLLDFFALCRGYGLASAFSLAALDFAFVSGAVGTERPLAARRRYAALAGGFAAAATLANLAWLNFQLALFFVFAGLQLVRTRGEAAGRSALRDWCLPQLPSLLLTAAIATPVIAILRAKQALYLGGENGFWRDTVGSLIDRSLYAQPYAASTATLVEAAIAVALVFAGVSLVVALRNAGDRTRGANLGALLGLLALCALGSQLQHALLGTPFLVGRTALFMLAPFLLAVLCALDLWSARGLRAAAAAAGALALLASLHTLAALNTTHTLVWDYDANTKRMLLDLREFVADDPAWSESRAIAGREPRPLRLGASWLHQPSINYYRGRLPLLRLAPLDRRGFEGEFDFYYFRTDGSDPIPGDDRVRELKRYPSTGHVLAVDRRGGA